jgi:2-oxoglutarate dehydrogenase E2 component (dihydrolipoamide succinyltransferase)
MPVEIRVPPLGESVVEATVGRWTKKEGDTVARDEILVELETDKITVEVAAPSAGTLGKLEKAEGDTVGVNELLATMEAGEAAAPSEDAPAESAAEDKGAPAAEAAAAPGPPQPAAGGAQTSPAVRTLAAEHGLDLGTASPAPGRTGASPRRTCSR